MRLTAVTAILDDRLRHHIDRPVAVAVSGGGDSVALLLATAEWARANGRPLLALTVDHGLQPQGAAWVEACAALAARLGVTFQALAWTGPKPDRGLPAAARDARHRLLAEAARTAGARVILMGHTADDRFEASLMRRTGSTTPEPRLWGPSPSWPEGRGLFLLRPLLGERRDAIRAWLRGRGETWIEDPANTDLTYARARARASLEPMGPMAAPCELLDLAADARALAAVSQGTAWGGLTIPRAELSEASETAAQRFVSAASVSAAGTSRPPRSDRVRRLTEALRRGETLTASLAGARIEAGPRDVSFMREAGEAARGGLAQIAVPKGRTTVWDGRFELAASVDGLSVRPLSGVAARLPDPDRAALIAVPAGARGGLPAVVDRSGGVRCPLLAPMAEIAITALAPARLADACGLVAREPAWP